MRQIAPDARRLTSCWHALKQQMCQSIPSVMGAHMTQHHFGSCRITQAGLVSDWYDLRSCLAGCIGGMMSIGSMNMKLHMKVVDGNRFRIRKVSGAPSSIVASDGRNVDIDISELR